MDNYKLQYYFINRPLATFLLLMHGLFSAGVVRSAEATDTTTLEQDLHHWLSQFQTPRPLEITKEIECLAQNIYFEARSESEQGQLAVGHVVMNRVAHGHYPNSVCGVVKQGGENKRYRCQFSWWCDGRSDLPKDKKAWRRSHELAKTIYMGYAKDPTGGALWYHADYVNPKWSTALVFGKKIGHHLFYLSKKQPVYALNTLSTLQPNSSPIKTSEQSNGFPHFKVSPSYSGMGTSINLPVLQL
jgi:hypothetical protein